MTSELTPREVKRLTKWAKKHLDNYEYYTVEEVAKIQELRTAKFNALYNDEQLQKLVFSGSTQQLNIMDDTESLKSFQKKAEKIKLELEAENKIKEEKAKSEADKVKKNLNSI